MNLFLIGYRCTGKSSVGKALAQRLNWPFVDTDRMIVDTAGAGITAIVANKGWAYFRDTEVKAVQTVCAADRQVVATGGGVVLDERNVSAMQASGKVVWLRADMQTIADRMLADDATAGNRPPLTGQGLIQEISTVLSERKPLYEAAADAAIDTDQQKIAAICDRILRLPPLKTVVGE